VRIDLHVHSNASDGTDDPAEVMRRAAVAGLDVVALTDHDTQAGLAEASAALPDGLTLVPGMELSCQLSCVPSGGRPPQATQTRSVHLLAYLFDPEDPALRAETAQIRDDRTYRARAMVDRMRELGADVTWEQVGAIAGGAVVGRPHLARALAASGAVATPADAFTADWIGDGGRAFVDRYAPDLARAVGLVSTDGTQVRPLKGFDTVHKLAQAAIDQGKSLTTLVATDSVVNGVCRDCRMLRTVNHPATIASAANPAIAGSSRRTVRAFV